MHDDPGMLAILAYDGLCTFEFGIAVELFALPRPEFDFAWYQTVVVAVDEGPMRAVGGLVVQVDADLSALQEAHTIVIPGWRGRDVPPPEALTRALQAAHARGARMLSICSGAFVLAAAGLLNGQRASTHWRHGEALAQQFPAVQVDTRVLFVDNGQVITSAGSAAGIDAGLHLISRDFGTQVANQVACRLVTAPVRSGGQAQFIPAPIATGTRQELASVLEWARERLDRPLTVADLARRALMSERTLLRRFVDATGMTPKAWLQQARLTQAKALLESSTLSVQRVSEGCGFGSVEAFRLAFRKGVGLTPAEFRRRFQRSPSSVAAD